MRAAALLAVLVSACAGGQAAPIVYGPSQRTAEPAPPQQQRAPSPARAETQTPAPPPRVAAPEPEPDWAAGEGTPLSAYALRREDVQPYDPARPPLTHRVGANQSLYDIATAYQVPLRALIEQNQLEAPFALEPGRELQLPPPRLHQVARGETLQDIARRYNVDARSLALLNRMRAPYDLRQGEQVVLPAMARARVSEPPPPAVAAPASPSAPLPEGSGQFAWPLRGEIVARFGPRSGGGRVDGLEIAGREGAPVLAAAAGDVVYAGSDIAAYDTLILVRHEGDFVTAYAYARRALVQEGQRVSAGQQIAELGARPDGSTRLLFQVRRGAQPVDPAPLMAPQ